MTWAPPIGKDGFRRYGTHDQIKEDKTRCIESVMDGWHLRQCNRTRGHGTGGLYCKQHSPERRTEKQRKWDEEFEARQAQLDYQMRLDSWRLKVVGLAINWRRMRTGLALEALIHVLDRGEPKLKITKGKP